MTDTPGREMDAAVAEAMGWLKYAPGRRRAYFNRVLAIVEFTRAPFDTGWSHLRDQLYVTPAIPFYSTNDGLVMRVWDQLVELERYPTMHERLDDAGDRRVWVHLVNPLTERFEADTKAHAICLAALSTREAEEADGA